MTQQRHPNPVQGRVILEVTSHHAVIYLCDRQGVVLDNEVFKYPFPLDKHDCSDECRDLFNVLYDALNDVVNAELQGGGGEKPESD
jgi:hypothetical protein